MQQNSLSLNAQEKRTAISLSGIYMLRMLGLFIVLPVFSVSVANLSYVTTPFLIGLALGIHGLAQAFFQIPLGMLSDKIGRKPVIISGLLIFIAGSIVAAEAHNIYTLIFGRFLQGMGAISAVIMAFAADSIREERRSKVMALIGIGIGFSFVLGLIIAAPMEAIFGIRGVFYFSAILGVGALLLVMIVLPQPLPRLAAIRASQRDTDISLSSLMEVFCNMDLLRLNIGVFILHALMISTFLILPQLLDTKFALAASSQWMFYTPILLGSFILMFPLLIWGEKRRCIKRIFPVMLIVLGSSQILLFVEDSSDITMTIIAMVLFFTAFNYMEACMPALVSRFCDIDKKGTALGVYAQFQFLGIFAGGSIAGLLIENLSVDSVYVAGTILCISWLILSLRMSEPGRLHDRLD